MTYDPQAGRGYHLVGVDGLGWAHVIWAENLADLIRQEEALKQFYGWEGSFSYGLGEHAPFVLESWMLQRAFIGLGSDECPTPKAD